MKNRFYTVVFAPLLFVACNSPESLTPIAVAQTEKVIQPVTKPISTEVKNTTTIKYISKPIVIEQVMLNIDGLWEHYNQHSKVH